MTAAHRERWAANPPTLRQGADGEPAREGGRERVREGGRERVREGGREAMQESGREAMREGRREAMREGGREAMREASSEAIGLMSAFAAVMRREVALALRQKGDVLTPLFFFVIVASLFPLAVGPESALLLRMAPGVIWVGALLAAMLSLQRMFAPDHADGTLEQLTLSATPLTVLVLGKVASHFLIAGVPLVVIAPVLGIQYGLDARSLAILALSLLLGTPVLSLIGGVGAALTLGVRGAGVLLSLLTLPLYIPVLIFGAGAVEADAAGLGIQGHLSLMAALLLLAVFFAPFAISAALRISLE